MTQVRFEPGAWTRSAGAFDEVSAAVGGALRTSGSAGGGATPIDAAVAEVVGRLEEVVDPVFRGIASGLQLDAETMRATAAQYTSTEDGNVSAGRNATRS